MDRKITARRSAVVVVLVLLLVSRFGVTENSWAADASYGTKSFDVYVAAHENNSFDFQEKITVDFWYPHHGIYRYIPENASKVSDISVPGYEYSKWTESNNKVLQIGSGSYTVDGVNEYSINYKLSAYDDNDSELDRLMLNVIPTGWETSIDHATAIIELPKKADLSNIQLYTGEAWSEENSVNAEATVGTDGKTIYVEAYDIPANNGITVIAELPEGYWTGETVVGGITPMFLFFLLVGPLAALIIWYMWGRDKHMVKTIEFYPPEGLTPGEVGYIIDDKADKCDVVSSIVYMANKGYMSIEEDGDHDYRFTKLKEISDSEPQYIKDIYNGIFHGGLTTAINSDLGETFGSKYMAALEHLQAMYSSSKKSIYSTQSKTARACCFLLTLLPIIAFTSWDSAFGQAYDSFDRLIMTLLLCASAYCVCSAADKVHSAKKSKTVLRILLALMWFECGLGISLSSSETLQYIGGIKAEIIKLAVVVAEVVIIFFSAICVARKAEYTDLMGKILGFKDFIRTAELDKLKELVEEDPAYFYNIMPYAYVFGLSDKWIKNFEKIELPKPEWYTGTRYTYFDGYLMGRMMSNCSAGVSNHVHAPIDVSGSGVSHDSWFSGGSGGGFSSGGGGFSGGGFGGGGGGAW